MECESLACLDSPSFGPMGQSHARSLGLFVRVTRQTLCGHEPKAHWGRGTTEPGMGAGREVSPRRDFAAMSWRMNKKTSGRSYCPRDPMTQLTEAQSHLQQNPCGVESSLLTNILSSWDKCCRHTASTSCPQFPRLPLLTQRTAPRGTGLGGQLAGQLRYVTAPSTYV